MTRKKVMAILLTATMTIGLAACGSSSSGDTTDDTADTSVTAETETETAESEDSSDKTEITLAFADASNDETMQAVHTAIEEVWVPYYEEEYGITINTLFADSGGDVGQQISDVENFVAQQVDAISIRPVDTDGIATAFNTAADAGIPALSTWWEANTENSIGTLIVVDNTYIGQLMGQWLIDYAEENDVTLKVGKVHPFVKTNFLILSWISEV